MAFTGVAALMTAEAGTVTVAMVAAAAVEVGTAMVVVGAVTGNQTLTKWGGAISLVGGVGGLAAGAMGSGAAASTAADASTSSLGSAGIGAAPDALPDAIDMGGGFNPATGAGDAVTADAAASGQGIVGDAAAGAPSVTAATADPTATMGGAPAASPTDVSTPAGSSGATGDATVFPGDSQSAMDARFGNTPAGGGAVQTPASDITSPTAVQTPAGSTQPTTGTNLTGSGGSANPNVNPTDVRLAAGTQTPPISSSSYWNKMMGVLQNPQNKTMLEMGSKLVGGALQGAQGQSQFNAKLDLENRRLAQTSYGSQVGQNKPHGIIQRARA